MDNLPNPGLHTLRSLKSGESGSQGVPVVKPALGPASHCMGVCEKSWVRSIPN